MKTLRALATLLIFGLAAFSGGAQAATATHSSTTVTVTVTAAPVAAVVTATAVPSSVAVGTPVIVTATVAAPTATGTQPTGTVSFYQGSATGTLIATTTLTNGQAACTFTTTGLTPGSYTITPVYNGNSLYF